MRNTQDKSVENAYMKFYRRFGWTAKYVYNTAATTLSETLLVGMEGQQ